MRKKFTDYMQSVHIDHYKIIPFNQCSVINEHKLRNFFPEKVPKSVMIYLAPYYTGNYPDRNVSLYAIPEDYHIFFDKINVYSANNNSEFKFTFKGFADNSPIDEIHAAASAGLGIIGDNGLLINERYGSFVFIGEIITDYEFDFNLYDEIKPIKSCEHCGNCKKACPSPSPCECLSAITQKRGNLNEHEINLIKSTGIAWGCDICQLVCPHNIDVPITEIDFFHKNLRSVINKHHDITNRAYAWRGEKVIHRNLTILN